MAATQQDQDADDALTGGALSMLGAGSRASGGNGALGVFGGPAMSGAPAQAGTDLLDRLATSPLIDPAAKWNAYAAGALAPAANGSFSAGMSGALGNLSAMQTEEGKLKAQYGPIIANALWQRQLQGLQMQAKAYNLTKEMYSGLDTAVGALQGQPNGVQYPDVLRTVSQRVLDGRVPPAVGLQYLSEVPTNVDNGWAQRRMMGSGMDANNVSNFYKPDIEFKPVGENLVSVEKNFNAPGGATKGVSSGGMTEKDFTPEIVKMGDSSLVRYPYVGNAAIPGSPEDMQNAAINRRLRAAWAASIVAQGAGGARPRPDSGVPSTPGGAPSGSPLSPTPSQGSPSALPAPMRENNAGALLHENGVRPLLGLNQSAPGVQTGPAQPGPAPGAPGVQPGPAPGAPGVQPGPAPAGATPPPLGGRPPVPGAGGIPSQQAVIDPSTVAGAVEAQKTNVKQLADYQDEVNSKASKMRALQDDFNNMNKLAGQFTGGVTAPLKMQAAGLARDVLRQFGVPEPQVKNISDTIMNGNNDAFANAQTFTKFATQNIYQGVRAALESGRLTNMEVKGWENASATASSDPKTFQNLANNYARLTQMATTEQQLLSKYSNDKSLTTNDIKAAIQQHLADAFTPTLQHFDNGATRELRIFTNPKTGLPEPVYQDNGTSAWRTVTPNMPAPPAPVKTGP